MPDPIEGLADIEKEELRNQAAVQTLSEKVVDIQELINCRGASAESILMVAQEVVCLEVLSDFI